MKAITVENLSKVYSVATANSEGMSFREMLIDQARSLFKKSQKQELFHALKDVSFEVEQGEVLGIIGKNGSGKSTLLKILSKITAPTSGRAIVRGRVASLLEVGTGFHAELSGRENIFMSGIILGMKRWEINQHFDEIVSFAGVERFLDMPVKKYSSGMRLRLAFSVAAHLQPEILLVDEVLAVGDYEFEKKCLKVMEGISNAGRTILFVSHNMDMVARLCPKTLLLLNGQQVLLGHTKQVINTYLMYSGMMKSSIEWGIGEQPGNEKITLQSIICLNEKNGLVAREQDLEIRLGYTIKQSGTRLSFILIFYDEKGNVIFSGTECLLEEFAIKDRKKGNYISTCLIPKNTFNEGPVYVSVRTIDLRRHLGQAEDNIYLEKILHFTVRSDMHYPVLEAKRWESDGVVRPEYTWKISMEK